MNRHILHKSFIALMILLLLSTAITPLFGQQIKITPGKAPQRKQRQKTEAQILSERARRAERSGSNEHALANWLKIISQDPWNAQAITGIPRNLLILKRYEEAEAFLGEMIVKTEFRDQPPKSPTGPASKFSLMLELGTVRMAADDDEAAWRVWNDALEDQNQSAGAVRSLVNTLQRNRLWEDSEELIRDYRKQAKNPMFMALELASSLQAQMNYAGATEELLLYSGSSPTAWQIAISHLNRFPDDSLVVEKVLKVFNRAVDRDHKNGRLQRIYAAYALKAGLLEESLNATIAADPLTKSGGMLVLQSARAMLNEGAVDLARRGYEQVLRWDPPSNTNLAAKAELGLGQCYEALGEWMQAKSAYETFVGNHPKAREVEEAKYRIAEIVLVHEQDVPEALTLFKGIWIRGRSKQKITAGLRIGDCHAWMNELGPAITAWEQVAALSRKGVNEDASQALLRIARANLWRDSTDQALAALDSISSGDPLNTAFNDAVLYTALLNAGSFYRAVRAFAEGDFAQFRNDNLGAAEHFSTAAGFLQYGRLAEWSRFQQALALREGGQPEAAIAVLDTFIISFPESVDLERALYVQALIKMEDVGDLEGALEQFQQFLIKHPRSLYLEQARRKARILTNMIS